MVCCSIWIQINSVSNASRKIVIVSGTAEHYYDFRICILIAINPHATASHAVKVINKCNSVPIGYFLCYFNVIHTSYIEYTLNCNKSEICDQIWQKGYCTYMHNFKSHFSLPLNGYNNRLADHVYTVD